MKTADHIAIKCADGFQLSGTLYEPEQLKAAVMIAPATGIKKTFYHSFAGHLSANGYGVISFDNRGIGDSRSGPVRESDASLVAWGQMDMTAVLETLKKTFPETTYHLIGHSAGGQLAGLMENAQDLTSMFNVSCSSGSLKNMDYPFKLQAEFFMNVFIPFSNLLFGHAKSQWVGMGEPLPRVVAAQWREWCNGSGYVQEALGKTIHRHHFDNLSIPSQWLYAADDDIANQKNVQEMVGVYKAIKAELITLHPEELGYKDIGHMKFFSSRRKELWKFALNWLGAHS